MRLYFPMNGRDGRQSVQMVTVISILAGADIAAAPALGYVRDHVLNGFFRWLLNNAVVSEAAVVPLIQAFHFGCAYIVALFNRRRGMDKAIETRLIAWATVLSLPAVLIAYFLDLFLYLQIPW
jgi:hypothetical protein